MHSVTFFPKNVTVQVEDGTDVLEAAFRAGVSINSVCGGEGTCGKCRVIVEGLVDSPPSKHISDEEWRNGYRLACQSKVMSDLVVFVPLEAQVAGHKILTSFHVARLGKLAPMVRSRYVELPRPSLENNLADYERLLSALDMIPGELSISLPLLEQLPALLRRSDWKLTARWTEERGRKRLVSLHPGDQSGREYGIALDIGTTTVVLSLIDLTTGEVIGQASDYNKQIVCGEDVLSRIAFTEECGLERPHGLIVDTINYLISKVSEESAECVAMEGRVCRDEISSMSVAGNTTMIHLFLGLDPRYIRYEPYVPTVNVPPMFRAKDLGLHINPEAPIYIVPGRASYVGGDIVADVLASEMYRRTDLSLLIDVGTNGEIVLGNEDWMVACSCSAGPAFEGGEVHFGMRAMTGAIDSVSIDENLEVSFTTINDAPPRGICGSGLIDLLGEMFLRGIIDKKGRIKDVDSPRVREGESGKEFVIVWAEESGIGRDRIARMDGDGKIKAEEERGRDIVISDDDIANIIRTKGAVYAACRVLLKSVNLSFNEVRHLYVAGGFGNYINLDKAIVLGLLPDIPRDRFIFLGNAALAGARLALLSKGKRKDALRIYERMTYLELSTTQTFFDEFSSSLFLPHTDISQFPTVEALLLGTRG